MSEELQEVKYYELINYKDSKAAIKASINQTAMNFVAIGYYLKHIRDKEMYKEDGYSGISEFAKAEFGISAGQASKFMSINDKFSANGNSPILLEQYKDFSSSKLQEMLYLTDQQLEQVTVGTTVAEIREIKKPEKTVSTSKQEPEKAEPAQAEPEPKPKPEEIDIQTRNTIIRAYADSLPRWKKENIRKEFQRPADASERINYLKSCTAWGWVKMRLDDKEKTLYLRKDDEDKLELSNWLHEEEGIIPEVKKIVFTFFELATVVAKMLTEEDYPEKPKAEEAHTYQHNNEPYGWTYNQIIQGLIEEIIKTKFTVPGMGALIIKAVGKEYYVLFAGEVGIYESNNLLFKVTQDRLKSEVEYFKSKAKVDQPEPVNDIQEPENVANESVEMCIHDAGRPCTDCNPYCHASVPENDTEMDETVVNESEDVSSFAQGNEDADQVETVTADIIQTVPEDEYDFEAVSQYSLTDVKDAILGHQKNLAAYRDCKLDAPIVKHEKMEMDALQVLEEDLYMRDMPDLDSKPELVQPELPILKNNDQRKDFIDGYTNWPIWIDLKETGERYYRYNLTDKVVLVVKVYLRHVYKGYTESKEIDYTSPQYYLLGIKINYSTKVTYNEDPTRTFAECSSNMTDMVNYLKEFQKKGA